MVLLFLLLHINKISHSWYGNIWILATIFLFSCWNPLQTAHLVAFRIFLSKRLLIKRLASPRGTLPSFVALEYTPKTATCQLARAFMRGNNYSVSFRNGLTVHTVFPTCLSHGVVRLFACWRTEEMKVNSEEKPHWVDPSLIHYTVIQFRELSYRLPSTLIQHTQFVERFRTPQTINQSPSSA